MDESISSFRGVWQCSMSFLFYFGKKFLLANSADSDQMPRSVESDLGLFASVPKKGLQANIMG